MDDQRATSIQGSVGLVNSPEPGSMILISSGLIGIGLFARRRARR
ncbi:MAG: PEP-CTERM sorting domain-containing protein [Acidobacteriota bacterium]